MENMNELVSRVINGDKQAFEAIYQATYRQVYYTCMSFLKNEQNAQDIMQDTYITALTHMQQLANPDRILAWLNRIAVNKCKTFLAKYMPEEFREEVVDSDGLEENDNFLPENYVTNSEKRKIVLEIMQEELSAVQYQTILLYYYNEMSVSEIAECMNCPEGTVTYRLSSARGKIKRAVQDYEDTSGVKLYSSGAVPLLTAIFIADAEKLMIPNVLNTIFASAGAATGATSSVGTASAASVASGVGMTTAKKACKVGLKGLFKTAKAKIITGIAATAFAAGGITGLILLNKPEQKQEPKEHYTNVNTVIVDNDYVTVTIDKIYDKGYLPTREEALLPIEDKFWSPEDCIVELSLENKSDEIVLVDINFFTVNNESMDNSMYADETYMLDPHATQVSSLNNNNNILNPGKQEYLKVDRDPITWAKIGYRVYVMDESYTEETLIEYNLTDIYFYDEEKLAPNYERKTHDAKEQVLVDNEQIKVTYVGTDMLYDENYESLWGRPYLYVENKSDHDFRISCYGDYISDLSSSCIFAGTNSYITDLNIENPDDPYGTGQTGHDAFLYEMIENETPFQFDIHIVDYTELAGGYVNTAYQGEGVLPNGMTGGEFEQYMTDSETVYPAQIINYEWTKESK